MENKNIESATEILSEDRSEKARGFRQRLDVLLNTPLTVENINTFADDTIDGLIDLTHSVVEDYQVQEKTAKIGTELEDSAYKAYGLPSIGDILSHAQEKVEQIKAISEYVGVHSNRTGVVITPPDAGRDIPTSGDKEGLEEKKLLPRIVTLLYVLETDFNIPKEEIALVQGAVTDTMMRRTPYTRVQIDQLKRLVYVCDEEENASYVFDMDKLHEQNLNSEDVDVMTKEERNKLIAEYPGIGKRLVQTKYWREHMSELLSSEIVESPSVSESAEDYSTVEQVSVSELDPWRGFWTDPETGKHWGALNNVARKSGFLNESSIYRILKDEKLPTKRVRNPIQRVCVAYCYEEITSQKEVMKLGEAPSVSKEGEWKEFYITPDGKHWGSVNSIVEKVSKSPRWINERIAGKTTKKIRDSNGRLRDAYCYEDIATLDEITSATSLPKIAESGEWEGFYSAPDGKHWGTLHALVRKTGLRRESLEKFAEGKESKEALALNKARTRIYSYEDLLLDPNVAAFIKLPEINGEREWEHFFTDKEGKHFGTLRAIERKLKIARRTIQRHAGHIASIRIRTAGKVVDAYPYEEIQKIFDKNDPS